MIWLYRKKKQKVWRMRIKGQNIERKKGEQEEVKQILNETLFKDPCWNNPHITCLGLYYHLLPYH